MSNDLTQTQAQGGEEWERARDRSLQDKRPPVPVPGYQVARCLGEGAYGEVWLATDQNNPGRQVAIKFYTRRGGDWALLAREVEKLNFLATDRYVVQLLDVGWNADPPYYVMEYMEKGSLAERLQAGTLPVPEAVALFKEVAVGVVNAHNKGVLHCDLKPANILLGPDGKPRLADFGQSRLSHEQTPALGTLFYMAPEQADLKAAPDTRWDVYALGALLYCLLTGEPPYRDDPGAKSLEQPAPLDERLARYRRLLKEAPRPRKHRHLRGVDRALVEIIDRCLAVNPAKRFANVQAVLNALDARALRRARRPLLVLGALGPILLLLVMAFLIRSQLATTVQKSTRLRIRDARISNQFAAQAVAEKVASKIDRRWRTLEQEASAPRFKKLVRLAKGKPVNSPEHRELQRWMDAGLRAHPDVFANSWVVLDDQGNLLVRSPHKKEIDRQYVGTNHAHRSFFNGLKTDLDPKAPRPPPLMHVHRSNVFHSKITGTRMVAFSVPVWRDMRSLPLELARPAMGASTVGLIASGFGQGPLLAVSALFPERATDPRLGVLMMTVEVGNFVELRPGENLGNSFTAVLVDRRQDDRGRRGAILEHPRLAELRQQKQKVAEKDLEFFVDVSQLKTWNKDYEDPVGKVDDDFAGRWLAASAPVVIGERAEVQDTGWVVLIQGRYDVAMAPVVALEDDMLTSGWWALGVAVTVVTGLWLFVIVVLNESVGGRLFARWRGRAGMPSESLQSAKESLRARKPSIQQGPTVTEATDQ